MVIPLSHLSHLSDPVLGLPAAKPGLRQINRSRNPERKLQEVTRASSHLQHGLLAAVRPRDDRLQCFRLPLERRYVFVEFLAMPLAFKKSMVLVMQHFGVLSQLRRHRFDVA